MVRADAERPVARFWMMTTAHSTACSSRVAAEKANIVSHVMTSNTVTGHVYCDVRRIALRPCRDRSTRMLDQPGGTRTRYPRAAKNVNATSERMPSDL